MKLQTFRPKCSYGVAPFPRRSVSLRRSFASSHFFVYSAAKHASGRHLPGRFEIVRPPARTLLTEAYAVGPSEPPLLEGTVAEHFSSIVKRFGDRNAVISRHQNITLTYRALDQDSNALARGLQKLGVKKGDRVAVSLGNNVEFATMTYALFKLGAILVPLNPAFTSKQIIAALKHLDASMLVIGAETNLPWKSPRSNEDLLAEIVPDIGSRSSSGRIESESVPSLQSIVLVDNAAGRGNVSALAATTSYASVLQNGGDGTVALEDQGLDPNEVANIQFTSGTTSMPKAACLTHRSILNNGKSIGDRMLLTEDDIVCCPPPLFHCFGCILGYMATATHGSTIVFPTEAFDPLASLLAVREFACTALYGVPTMFLSQLALIDAGVLGDISFTGPETTPSPSASSTSSVHSTSSQVPRGFSSLRTGIAAGSAIPAALMSRLHSTLNLHELTICYGMTETSPVSTMTTTTDPLDKRIDSVGRPLPHVHLRILDPTDPTRRTTLRHGERGEVAVSGYLCMTGYWGDEGRTAEAMRSSLPARDGGEDENGRVWMLTGDEGSLDNDGYLKITGRIKDLIIRGGENIHPLEIENCLLGHRGVADVSCVGVPDERYGEVVGAFVVRAASRSGSRGGSGGSGSGRGSGGAKGAAPPPPPLDEEAVRGHVRRNLSAHLVPKHVWFVDEFPKTASGKVQKFKLKTDAVRLLGL